MGVPGPRTVVIVEDPQRRLDVLEAPRRDQPHLAVAAQHAALEGYGAPLRCRQSISISISISIMIISVIISVSISLMLIISISIMIIMIVSISIRISPVSAWLPERKDCSDRIGHSTRVERKVS